MALTFTALPSLVLIKTINFGWSDSTQHNTRDIFQQLRGGSDAGDTEESKFNGELNVHSV